MITGLFRKLCIISVSGHYINHFELVICQTIVGIRINSQFYELLNFIFWRVFAIWPILCGSRSRVRGNNCRALHYDLPRATSFLSSPVVFFSIAHQTKKMNLWQASMPYKSQSSKVLFSKVALCTV